MIYKHKNMEIKDLLPIRTIVVLKEGEKKLMIIGVMQSEASATSKEYDYLGIVDEECEIEE